MAIRTAQRERISSHRTGVAMAKHEEMAEGEREGLDAVLRETDAKKATVGDEAVHYASGDIPLCGEDVADVMFTYEPEAVVRCVSCMRSPPKTWPTTTSTRATVSSDGRKSAPGRGRVAPGGPAIMSPLRQDRVVESAACIMSGGGHGAGAPIITEIISPGALRIAYNGAQIGLKCLWHAGRPVAALEVKVPALTLTAMNGTVRANLITGNQ